MCAKLRTLPSFPVFLRMNRFQHCGNTFHMFPWTHRECIPIPVDNTALPLCCREKISDNPMQPGTFIRHDQFYSGKSAILQVTQKICPRFFSLPTPFCNANDLRFLFSLLFFSNIACFLRNASYIKR